MERAKRREKLERCGWRRKLRLRADARNRCRGVTLTPLLKALRKNSGLSIRSSCVTLSFAYRHNHLDVASASSGHGGRTRRGRRHGEAKAGIVE